LRCRDDSLGNRVHFLSCISIQVVQVPSGQNHSYGEQAAFRWQIYTCQLVCNEVMAQATGSPEPHRMGSEVPDLSTRPAARWVAMRVSVFYIVVFETNSSRPPELSFPILLPSTNQATGPGLLGLTGWRVVPGLDQRPTLRRLLRSLLDRMT
jgi:hypothetical protein